MEICVKMSLISILSSFLLVFNYDFVIHIDFTNVAASNTASNDVTNWVTHRIFNTNFLFFILSSKLMRNVAVLADFNTI